MRLPHQVDGEVLRVLGPAQVGELLQLRGLEGQLERLEEAAGDLGERLGRDSRGGRGGPARGLGLGGGQPLGVLGAGLVEGLADAILQPRGEVGVEVVDGLHGVLGQPLPL